MNPGQFRPRESSIDEISQIDQVIETSQEQDASFTKQQYNNQQQQSLKTSPEEAAAKTAATLTAALGTTQSLDKPVTSFYGKVGINTDKPDEALTIVGNAKLTGVMLQPSDIRVKENIEPVCCHVIISYKP